MNQADLNTLTGRYTDEAIGFIRKNRNRPFFVYLPHTMPHTRLGVSDEFRSKSKRGLYGDVIEVKSPALRPANGAGKLGVDFQECLQHRLRLLQFAYLLVRSSKFDCVLNPDYAWPL